MSDEVEDMTIAMYERLSLDPRLPYDAVDEGPCLRYAVPEVEDGNRDCLWWAGHPIRVCGHFGQVVIAWPDVVRTLQRPWLKEYNRLVPSFPAEFSRFFDNSRSDNGIVVLPGVTVSRLARFLVRNSSDLTFCRARDGGIVDFVNFLSKFWAAEIYLRPRNFISVRKLRKEHDSLWREWRDPTYQLSYLGIIELPPSGASFFSEEEIELRALAVTERGGRGNPALAQRSLSLEAGHGATVAEGPTRRQAKAAAKGEAVAAAPINLVFKAADGQDIAFAIDEEARTIWASQDEMARLFGCTQQNVAKHLRKIFSDGELVKESVSKKSLQFGGDGKRYRIAVYNLPALLSVGYKVDSPAAVEFRQRITLLVERKILADVFGEEGPGVPVGLPPPPPAAK